MNVYLLRHGEAERRAASDSQRALTERGRQDVRAVAGLFAQKKLALDFCAVSPYLRAQQSAEIFLQVCGSQLAPDTQALLTPESNPHTVLRYLETITNAEVVLLVAHNPLLSTLFALLTEGESGHSLKVLETAELCCIGFDVVGAGLGTSRFNLLPGDRAGSA